MEASGSQFSQVYLTSQIMQRKAVSKAEAERRAGQRERENMFDTKLNFCFLGKIYTLHCIILLAAEQTLLW